MLDVAIQIEGAWDESTRWQQRATSAVTAAIRNSPHGDLIDSPACIEVSVRLTTDAEVQSLNAAYRGKDAPTNVLSFPMVQPDLIEALANTDDGEVLLGDIVLADGVCAAEADDKGIAIEDHATHLIVHGTFHLLGYDHQGNAEAEDMESLERETMARLGLHDPYEDHRG